MGKGDKKSKKGKIRKGSYGNSRQRKTFKAKLKVSVPTVAKDVVVAEVELKPKKAASKKKTDA